MSDTSVVQTPREKRYGWAMQSVFGTAEIDAIAVTEIDCEPFEVNRDVKEFIVNGAHGSRQQNVGDVVVQQKQVMPSATIELYLKREELAAYLALLTQNVSEGITPQFAKTHTFLATQPDFQANAGYFITLFERDIEASKSIAVKDMIVKAMTISLTGDEPVKASIELVGLGATDDTANPTGTWTQNGLSNLFYRSDLDICQVTLTAGAKNFHLHELELSFSREVVGVGNDGAGGYAVYGLTQPENKFKLTVAKGPDWSSVLSDHAAGTEIDVRVGWGNASPGTDIGDLDFAIHGKLDGPEGAVKSHDELIYGVMTGRMLKASATESITIIHADGVDATWI